MLRHATAHLAPVLELFNLSTLEQTLQDSCLHPRGAQLLHHYPHDLHCLYFSSCDQVQYCRDLPAHCWPAQAWRCVCQSQHPSAAQPLSHRPPAPYLIMTTITMSINMYRSLPTQCWPAQACQCACQFWHPPAAQLLCHWPPAPYFENH